MKWWPRQTWTCLSKIRPQLTPTDVIRRDRHPIRDTRESTAGKPPERRICKARRIDVMTTTKFVVRVNRGTRAPEFVQRIDPTPIQTTTNRRLALIMGR